MFKVALAVCLVSVAFASEAFAQRNPCRSVVEVPAGGRFIYKQSAPLRSGGVGTPLIGYRKEPTLIMNQRRDCGVSSYAIYDTKFKKLASGPRASAHGHACRARFTNSTSGMCRTARRNTGSKAILIKISGTQCARIPNSGRCYGSVKGLCNQEIC